MAWYDTSHGTYYRYTSTEARANAWEVYNYFRGLGNPWEIVSIAAMCGNMMLESTLNPYIRETTQSGAFGLVQWITHKQDMISWAQSQGLRATSGPAQVRYIEQERNGIDDQWQGRQEYVGMRFSDFAYNTRGYDLQTLTHCFWRCFERSNAYQTDRELYARYYYSMFTGEDPPGPGPGPEPGTVPAWLLFRRRPWWKLGGRKYITT